MIVFDLTTLGGILADIREQFQASLTRGEPDTDLLEPWRLAVDGLDAEQLAPNDLARVVLAVPEAMRLQACMELAEICLVFPGRDVRAVNSNFLKQYVQITLSDAFPELAEAICTQVDELGKELPPYEPVTS